MATSRMGKNKPHSISENLNIMNKMDSVMNVPCIITEEE
jgi:hypothetical protein